MTAILIGMFGMWDIHLRLIRLGHPIDWAISIEIAIPILSNEISVAARLNERLSLWRHAFTKSRGTVTKRKMRLERPAVSFSLLSNIQP